MNHLASKGPSIVYLDMMISPPYCLLDIVLNASLERNMKEKFHCFDVVVSLLELECIEEKIFLL